MQSGKVHAAAFTETGFDSRAWAPQVLGLHVGVGVDLEQKPTSLEIKIEQHACAHREDGTLNWWSAVLKCLC